MVSKKLKYYYFLIPVFAAILFGCQKSSINGHLDGRWQIVEIATETETTDVLSQQLYYNFYLHVCDLSYYGGVLTAGNLFYDNSTIILDFPYINSEEGDMKLERYGIYSNPVEFHVEHLDRKNLIMTEGDTIRITLRKF